MSAPAEESTAPSAPAAAAEATADQHHSLFDKFNVKEYASRAEKGANELNSQFGRFCHKLTGEKDPDAKPDEAEQPNIVSELRDIGSRGYGLMNMLEKKWNHEKSAENSAPDAK